MSYLDPVGTKKKKTIDIPEEVIPEVGDFPIDIFPKQIIDVLKKVELTMNHPVDITGSTLLNLFGGLIGNKIKFKMMSGWEAPGIIWTAIVGASGAAKSHPVSFIMAALDKIDDQYYKDYSIALAEFEKWDKESEDVKKLSHYDKPSLKQIVVRDTTMEALQKTHEFNKNGLIMYRDELKGWLGSMNSYRKGSDEETWLEIFNNKVATVGRVTKDPLRISNSFVNVLGTIQDLVLSEIISKDNGLVERFLFTKTYSEIKQLSRNRMKQKDVDDLYDSIRMAYFNYVNIQDEILLEADDDVFDLIIEADKRIIELQKSGNETTKFVGYLSKMRTYLPRFILIICVIDDTFNETELVIRGEHIRKAEQLINYYIKSARKLFSDINKEIEIKDTINSMNGKSNAEKIIELKYKSFSNVSISQALGVSPQYVGKIIKQNEK